MFHRQTCRTLSFHTFPPKKTEKVTKWKTSEALKENYCAFIFFLPFISVLYNICFCARKKVLYVLKGPYQQKLLSPTENDAPKTPRH